MATSKDKILKSIRKYRRPDVPLPDMHTMLSGSNQLDLQEQIENLKQRASAAHVEVYLPSGTEEINNIIQRNYPSVKNIFCNVEGINAGNLSVNDLSSVSKLDSLELAILKGCFVVEENAAVWITGEQMPYRSVITAAEFLILVVNKENIVHNMHDAYQQTDLSSTGYGMFICGPSKTADIEQTLVIGAHGAKKLSLILI